MRSGRRELTLLLLKRDQFLDGLYAMRSFLHSVLLEILRRYRSMCDLKGHWVVQHDCCIRGQRNYGLLQVGSETN